MLKVDLVDLCEVRTVTMGGGRHLASIDDGGESQVMVHEEQRAKHDPKPDAKPVPNQVIMHEEHHIGSLSDSLETLTLSREYGASGHVGPTYSLQRVADRDDLPLSAPCTSRSYKYVYEEAMASSAAHIKSDARRALHTMPSVSFNGAREAATKASRLGIAQAWCIDHLSQAELAHNYDVLRRVSVLLLDHPELRCEVHGRTSTPHVCDADLAAYFGLDANLAMRQVMDRLAYERASSCVEALVKRGVPRGQLSASFAGCTGEQRVVFIPRDSFHAPIAPRVPTEVEAVFQR